MDKNNGDLDEKRQVEVGLNFFEFNLPEQVPYLIYTILFLIDIRRI